MVMPKDERVAAVDSMMEVVDVRNEIAATARLLKRFTEENGELKNKIKDLVEENTDMKCEMERLHSQVLSKVLGKEEGGGEVKEKPKDEELSVKGNEVMSMKENRRRERGNSEGKKRVKGETRPQRNVKGTIEGQTSRPKSRRREGNMVRNLQPWKRREAK